MVPFSWLPFVGDKVRTRDNTPAEETSLEPTANSDTPTVPFELMSFEAIADKVESLQSELAYAHDLCEQANLQFAKYRVNIDTLKSSLKNGQAIIQDERKAMANLQHLLSVTKSNCSKLQAQSQFDTQEVRKLRIVNAQLQARLDAETASSRAMANHARAMEQRFTETRFDLEYLKCTLPKEQPASIAPRLTDDAPLPAQPFVVVLVDGDAYNWSREIFIPSKNPNGLPIKDLPDHLSPGALAATRIRNEVIQYIMSQDGKIPITSKVVTRVFCNFGGLERHLASKPGSRAVNAASKDFAVSFTEKVPLFDYFDAGRGKERVDDKIRENFSLYLSSPNCHAIFVAACLDNGFARMLEPYTGHEPSYNKIVLVSPGHMALEIFKLNFKTVSWPSVFATPDIRPDQLRRHQKELKKQQQGGWLWEKQNLVRAVPPKAEDNGITNALATMVQPRNLNISMGKFLAGVGIRNSKLVEAIKVEREEVTRGRFSDDDGID